jgi:hypothetical protein
MDKTGWVLVSVSVGLLLWRGRWRKTNVLLGIAAAAATLAVGTGFAYEVAIRLGAGAAAVSSKLTLLAFGVEIPWLLSVLALVVVILDVWKGATATNMTVLLAIVGVLTMGAIPGPAGQLVTSTASGVASVVTAFFAAAFQ